MTHPEESTLFYQRIYSGRRSELNRVWESVLHLAKRYDYAKRSTIRLTQGMQNDFYYLAEGQLCDRTYSLSGRERHSLTFENGCLFNIAFAMLHPSDETLWYCLKPSVVWRFPHQLLRDNTFIAQHPQLIINLLESMSFNLLSIHTWETEMFLAPPLARVSRYILGLCSPANKERTSPGVTQQEAAAELGMHRATFALIIKQLRENGILESFTKSKVRVLDMPRLTELARQ